MTVTQSDQRIEAVRRFNRFYTARIGALQQGLLRSPFTLAEARVLFEIAQRDVPSAGSIARDLDLDPGYLSRLLRALMRRGLVVRVASADDRRIGVLRLTEAGAEAFASLDAGSRAEVAAMLNDLPGDAASRLVESMARISRLLGSPDRRSGPVRLRPHRPGDLGWIVHRHGALYAQEYGWGERFESLVAGVVGDFVRDLRPERERCFIAELDGEVVGSAMLVAGSEGIAKLRLVLVEPEARGLGIGRRLCEECLSFASTVGYQKVTLWTQSVLIAARRIYERSGFRLVRQEAHRSFGVDLVGETWERELGS